MFYKKNLENIEALNAEKLVLMQQLSLLQKGDEQVSEKGTKNSKAVGLKLIEATVGKSKVATIAMQILPMIMPILGQKLVNYGVKKIVISTVKQVGFGYLKWKAIEIGYGFIADKIKKRKEAQ